MRAPEGVSRAASLLVAAVLLACAGGALAAAVGRVRGGAGAGAGSPGAGAGAIERFDPVDINHATADEIELLPGVGPSVAARIVADRTERGPFARPEELDRVRGIGAATVAKLRPFVVCGER
ncbi:MAG: helix-hairpin-helix domain-containing protein [Phycisphaerales bacterium]